MMNFTCKKRWEVRAIIETHHDSLFHFIPTYIHFSELRRLIMY